MGTYIHVVEFAFIMESPTADYQTSKAPCDLIVAAEEFGPTKGKKLSSAYARQFKWFMQDSILVDAYAFINDIFIF